MRARLFAAVVGLSASLAFGCGGKGSEALAPPGNLTIAFTGFDVLDVSWTEPSMAVDGYEVEARLDGGPWLPVSDTLVPPGTVGGWIFLEPAVPELVTIGVRVRSARGADRSAWSPEATAFRGVRPPASLTPTTTVTVPFNLRVPPVHLEWVSESLVATAFELERAPVDGPGAGIFVPVATFAAADRAYDDDDVWEGAWDYQLRAGNGTVWSTWTPARSEAVQIVPPEGLTAVAVAGGVQLAWTNRSRLAEQVVLRIEPDNNGGALATLPAGSNQYLDAPYTPWPATRYAVSASIVAVGSVPGPIAALGPLTLTQPIPLTGTARLAPGAMLMALSDGGLLHAALWSFPPSLQRDTGAGWERHELTSAQSYAMPGVLADEAGRPHTVVYRGYPDMATTALVHEWWDGAAWKEETVVMAPADGATWGLGPGGVLHVLVNRRETSGFYTPVHHAVAGGNVISTDLVPTVLPPPPDIYPYGVRAVTMAVAHDGTAWLALSCAAAPLADTIWVLMRRGVDGSWSQQLAPSQTPVSISVATVVAGSAENAALIYDRSDLEGSKLRVLQRGAGGWAAEQTVPLPAAGMELHGATLAADGVRLSLLMDVYPGGLWLTSRGAGGWGSALLGGPPPQASWLRLLWDGRTSVVVPHGPEMWAEAWVSAYVEPGP